MFDIPLASHSISSHPRCLLESHLTQLQSAFIEMPANLQFSLGREGRTRKKSNRDNKSVGLCDENHGGYSGINDSLCEFD